MTQKIQSDRKTHSVVRYYGIDIIKLICAFLIIPIHVEPFSDALFSNANTLNFFFTKIICRIAVPFYFAASGFLLFRNMNVRQIDWERIKRYCFKLLRLFGLWNLLLFIGGKGHLWYLSATVVGVICVSLCFHWHIKMRVIVLLALGLYGVGLLGDSYYGFIESFRAYALFDYALKGYEYFFRVTRNGLFMGFPFLLIGSIFALKKIRIKPILAALGFVVSMSLMIVEAYFLQNLGGSKDHNMYLSLIPVTFFLFALAISIELNHNSRYEKMQIIAMLIYYIHLMVSVCIAPVFDVVLKFVGIDLHPFCFLGTVLVTVLTAMLILKLSQNSKFTWLQHLYK